MKKIINIGTQKTWGGRHYQVYCSIEFEDGRLSIAGVGGPLPSGNCLGSCGQINDDLYLGMEKLGDGWTPDMFLQFLEIWSKWHLNDLHAECIHQERLGWTWETHPCAECPVCGYKLGTGWTKRDVPQDVIDFLFALPSSETTPAWV